MSGSAWGELIAGIFYDTNLNARAKWYSISTLPVVYILCLPPLNYDYVRMHPCCPFVPAHWDIGTHSPGPIPGTQCWRIPMVILHTRYVSETDDGIWTQDPFRYLHRLPWRTSPLRLLEQTSRILLQSSTGMCLIKTKSRWTERLKESMTCFLKQKL